MTPLDARQPALEPLDYPVVHVETVKFCHEEWEVEVDIVGFSRHRPRHLKRRPVRRGPVGVGAAATVWATGSQAHAGEYVVRPGDTLSAIADRTGTTVARLAAANGIQDPDFILAGRRLRVPATATPTAAHEVSPGETLASIARRHGTTVDALIRANELADPNFIVAGEMLEIAGTASGPAAPSAAPTLAPASRVEIGTSLQRHARAHGVDAALVKAVAWQESTWRQDVVSSAGAIGVMQVMPGTARYVNGVLGEGSLNVRVMDDNVHLGVRYLRHLLDTMPGEREALAAYQSGPSNVGARLAKYQREYVDAVLNHKSGF